MQLQLIAYDSFINYKHFFLTVYNNTRKWLLICAKVNQLGLLCWHLHCTDPWCSWSWKWQLWAYFKPGLWYLHQQSHRSPQNMPAWSEKMFTVTNHCMVSDHQKYMTYNKQHYHCSIHITVLPLVPHSVL